MKRPVVAWQDRPVLFAHLPGASDMRQGLDHATAKVFGRAICTGQKPHAYLRDAAESGLNGMQDRQQRPFQMGMRGQDFLARQVEGFGTWHDTERRPHGFVAS
jgi:hypothetical protein